MKQKIIIISLVGILFMVFLFGLVILPSIKKEKVFTMNENIHDIGDGYQYIQDILENNERKIALISYSEIFNLKDIDNDNNNPSYYDYIVKIEDSKESIEDNDKGYNVLINLENNEVRVIESTPLDVAIPISEVVPFPEIDKVKDFLERKYAKTYEKVLNEDQDAVIIIQTRYYYNDIPKELFDNNWWILIEDSIQNTDGNTYIECLYDSKTDTAIQSY